MALVGSPALQHDDQADEDFFEQLASDLGSEDQVSDIGHSGLSYRPEFDDVSSVLNQDQQEETSFTDVFSKLSITGTRSGLVTSEDKEEHGKIDALGATGDDFWLEDTISEQLASGGLDSSSHEGTSSVDSSLEENLAGNHPSRPASSADTASVDSGTLDAGVDATNLSLVNPASTGNRAVAEGLPVPVLDGPSSLLSPPLVLAEADPQGKVTDDEMHKPHQAGILPREGSFSFAVNNVESVASEGWPQQNVAPEVCTSEPLSLESEELVSGNEPKNTEGQGQSSIKELQWSCFSDVCTTEDHGAFGSFSDFLSELDTGTGSISNDGWGAQSGLHVDSSATFGSDRNSPQQGWGSETGIRFDMLSSATSGLYGAGQQQLGGDVHYFDMIGVQEQVHNHVEEPNVHLPTMRLGPETQGLSDTSFGGVGEQVLEGPGMGRQDFASEPGVEPHGDSLVSYKSDAAQGHQTGFEQPSWENLYPGWFFDYVANEWKQIEGYDASAGLAVVDDQVSVTGGGQSLSSYGKDPGISSGMEEKAVMSQGPSNATDYPHQSMWLAGQELGTLPSQGESGSIERIEAHAPQPEVYQQPAANNDTEPQQQTSWEQQYPGWRYDYQAQEWRQITDNSQGWQSGVDSSFYKYEQDNKIGQVAPQAADSGHLIQGSSSLPTPQGNWMGQGQPNHQDTAYGEINQNAYDIGGPASAYSRGASFNSWMGSAPADSRAFHQDALPNSNQQSNGSINSTVATFQGGRNGTEPWLGMQGYENSFSHYYDKSQMDYAQMVDNATHFANLPPSYFPQTHQYTQASIAPRTFTEALRSSAGRPPHALAAFGFGGKLATMKLRDPVTLRRTDGDQATSSGESWTTGQVVFHDLNQLVENSDSRGRNDGPSYFTALNRQGLSGPLVGGGVTTKELFKWIDERVTNCELEDPYCTNSQVLSILWGVLKTACQHYGKLRSMVGSAGINSQADDGPEAALGKLFASAKSHSPWNQGISASPNPLQSVPSEHQLQATALDMKKCLVAGKRKEALQLAQQGQLWGPALVLAWQLGEKFYADTVTLMAQQQFVPGSPLRTLCLLFAGQTTELFTNQNMPSSAAALGPYSAGAFNSGQDGAGGMLGDWLENLAIIAANRTKGDEQVIMHLGDCLWKARGEVAGAHTCYLVAEANFESFSGNARLCLIGADHFKHPRTFATPQAIQRTELYEYAKVLGNPQFILVPFQPYKLIYAHMLAEAGKIPEALRYCQAVTKTLRNAGRAPEVEICRQFAVALEDRLRLHSQGGYGLNLAPGKLVGKFFSTIDSTIHRIIGGPPPPQASESSQSSTGPSNAGDWYTNDQQRTGNTPVRANLSPLVPSASISNLFNANNQVDVPPRSVSEPDFSKSPKQENPTSSEHLSAPPKHRSNEPSGGGYLGRFGSQFLAKAVGLIKPNKKEAKLGEKNKFYYDEKLKRWVEEGVEHTPEEVALPPPPTAAKFVSSFETPTLDAKPGVVSEGQVSTAPGSISQSSGMPPMPPSVNQFSARGRLQGVRSRYVDTFNKGGSFSSPAKPTQSPIVPSTGRALTPSPAQFFVPAPLSSGANDSSQVVDNGRVYDSNTELASSASIHAALNGHSHGEHEPLVPKNLSSSFMAVPSIQRHSSAGNVAMYANNGSTVPSSQHGGNSENGSFENGSMSRAVSWSGYPISLPQADETSIVSTVSGTAVMQRFVPPNGGRMEPNHILPVMKPEASKQLTIEGILNSSLPSPPQIEPPRSYIGIDSSFIPGAREGGPVMQIGSGNPSSAQGGIYGDMQEVEL